MSLFTSSPTLVAPPCPRCGKADFVRLVRQDKEHVMWDCKRCPIPTTIREKKS